MKLIRLVKQALPLSVAKQYSRNWDKTRLKDWFDGKYRVYIPLGGSPNGTYQSEYKHMIDVILSTKGYQLTDYQKGLAKNKKYDRQQKIGKILQKINPALLQKFTNDPTRQTTKKKPIICISRHPYDIAGMSTDRGWTSCKNLGTTAIHSTRGGLSRGLYAYHLVDQKEKLLIAYLINQDDKNIEHPIARINIAPYINTKDPSDIRYAVTNKCYGSAGSFKNEFKKTVQNWLQDKQGPIKPAIYKLNPTIYNDRYKQQLTYQEIWKGGIWTQQQWVNGKWHKGTWKGKIWHYGQWMDGTWQGGLWQDGTWKDGTWQDGQWQDGQWQNGTWNGGIWQRGQWRDGVWMDGDWKDGIWNTGTWQAGTWQDGLWRGGIWQDGSWHDGTWISGTWQDGTWRDGEWNNGIWKYGVWFDGTWYAGTWQTGIWMDGDWKGGTWKEGWIHDPQKTGNFQKDWDWDEDLVLSTMNPKEYFKNTK